MSEIDWSTVPAETAREIQRQGEMCIEAQFRAALAADARAMSLSGTFAAVASAITGGAIVAATAQAPNRPLLAAGIVAAAMFYAALALLFAAARPALFGMPGNEPRTWWNEDDLHGDFAASRGAQIELDQAAIERNEARMARNGRKVRWAMILGMSAPAAGALAAAIAWAASRAV